MSRCASGMFSSLFCIPCSDLIHPGYDRLSLLLLANRTGDCPDALPNILDASRVTKHEDLDSHVTQSLGQSQPAASPASAQDQLQSDNGFRVRVDFDAAPAGDNPTTLIWQGFPTNK